MKRKLPLNAVYLRYLAIGLMILDHLWASVVPGNDWMTILGRLAFPIFAFQTAEGYYHTSDFKKYAKRLLLFGLLSEIPFNLFMVSSPIDPFGQNVMFTLLLGLYGVRAMDKARQDGSAKAWIKGLAIAAGLVILGQFTFVDYRGMGVLTVIAFGVLRNIPFEKAAQVIAMVAIHWLWTKGQILMFGSLEIPKQAFAILALIPIWLYNGEKGPRNKVLQYGSYLFYPGHMVILYLITALM